MVTQAFSPDKPWSLSTIATIEQVLLSHHLEALLVLLKSWPTSAEWPHMSFITSLRDENLRSIDSSSSISSSLSVRVSSVSFSTRVDV
jgi:hypothetical protein